MLASDFLKTTWPLLQPHKDSPKVCPQLSSFTVVQSSLIPSIRTWKAQILRPHSEAAPVTHKEGRGHTSCSPCWSNNALCLCGCPIPSILLSWAQSCFSHTHCLISLGQCLSKHSGHPGAHPST